MESAEPERPVNGHTLSPRSSSGQNQGVATTTTPPPEGDVSSTQTQTPASESTIARSDILPDVIPPYFDGAHLQRSDSATLTVRHGGIDLIDQSDEDHEIGRACWAKNVTIEDFVVVSGPTGIGAYVVWHCTIETFKGGNITLRKRYSEFDSLRANLVRAFPLSAASIPELPRKSLVSRFRAKFLEQRKAGLSHFLTCILLNPQFSRSPIVTEFINS